jgi:hypothetical protein
LSSNFPFSVHQSPGSGLWSVATATMIVCHLADEVTAKELTAKAFDLPAAIISEAFANPSDVLEWRATWQQAVAYELQSLSETVEDLTDATAEEIAELRESVSDLREVTAERTREQDLAEQRRQLATLEQRFDAAVERTLKIINKPSHGPNMQRQNRTMVVAATWETDLGERIKELRRQLA